jgi:hypothetical protein
MDDQIVDIPGVGEVAFPGGMDDAAIAAAAKRLYTESQHEERSRRDARVPAMVGIANPAAVGAGNVARAAAVQAGERLATSPTLTRVVTAASGPAVNAAARAIGAGAGSLPGYILGEAATNPAVGKTVEHLLRGSGELLARVASSPITRAITGPVAAIATMPFSEAGDRPAGETPSRTASRQAEAAIQFKEQVNREAGRQVITGNTTDEILASIAAYRGRK